MIIFLEFQEKEELSRKTSDGEKEKQELQKKIEKLETTIENSKKSNENFLEKFKQKLEVEKKQSQELKEKLESKAGLEKALDMQKKENSILLEKVQLLEKERKEGEKKLSTLNVSHSLNQAGSSPDLESPEVKQEVQESNANVSMQESYFAN